MHDFCIVYFVSRMVGSKDPFVKWVVFSGINVVFILLASVGGDCGAPPERGKGRPSGGEGRPAAESGGG